MTHDSAAPAKAPRQPEPPGKHRLHLPPENACNPARVMRGPLDHQADCQQPRQQAQ